MGHKNKSTKFVNLADPLVSVITPTFNRRNLLKRTLNSLVNQSYKNIEILVINDCGEDVQDVVESFNDNRIKYFQNEINSGLAFSRNVGLKNLKGSFFCLCDDDDIYTKYAVEMRMYLMKKLNADATYTRSLLDHWEKKDDGYVSIGKTLYWDNPYFSKDLLLIQNICPCSNATISMKAWERSNYYQFDQTLTTTEDQDFWTAISRQTDFYDLQIVDTECSRRNDKTQMTNNLDFSKNWIKVFKKWRHTAINLQWVTESQNSILRSVGINPADYGL